MPGPIRIWGAGCTERQVEQGVLLEYERVASTMDIARARLRAGDAFVGVRSEYQSAGRGRMGASWLAPPGACLLVTYIVPSSKDPEFARNLAFASGVAVAEAVETCADVAPRLKWPNDVILSGRKMGGILIEEAGSSKRSSEATFFVGIGLNANVDRFPEELSATATSLELETGLLCDILELEAAVRDRLFSIAYLPWPEILARWRGRDDTSGRRYRAPGPGDGINGVAIGVTDEGLLRIETEDGVVDVLSATSKS